jgi:hypothetical protein
MVPSDASDAQWWIRSDSKTGRCHHRACITTSAIPVATPEETAVDTRMSTLNLAVRGQESSAAITASHFPLP